ncbi:hypothetical protein KY330_03760 [Candidatus Woesearchaeota archaeon]|nr:hypothetical protein [Candidatus Woesearchaeota archaeon]
MSRLQQIIKREHERYLFLAKRSPSSLLPMCATDVCDTPYCNNSCKRLGVKKAYEYMKEAGLDDNSIRKAFKTAYGVQGVKLAELYLNNV